MAIALSKASLANLQPYTLSFKLSTSKTEKFNAIPNNSGEVGFKFSLA